MGISYKVNEEFFETWNPIMAYVLGYLYADGSIYKSSRGSYINVSSIDKLTIYKIKKWLSSQHTIREEMSTYANSRMRFILRVGNKKIFASLTRLGLYPSKSLTIRLPSFPDEFFADFLRGYFDGDGCVNLYRTRGVTKRLIVRKLSVIFSSGSKLFLEDLLIILKKRLDLKQTKIYKGTRSYQLRFATSDSRKILYFMYNKAPKEVLLKRKFLIFLKYLKLRNIDFNTATW